MNGNKKMPFLASGKDKTNPEFRKIKSLNFLYEINENGTYLRNVKSKKRIKIQYDKDDYAFYMVCIGGRKGKTIRRTMHQLVAECWLGDRPEGYEIHHKDHNKHNNHYSNLVYLTKEEHIKTREYDKTKYAQIMRDNRLDGWNAVETTIERNGVVLTFKSMSECSRFLQCSREYMKQRRKYIKGWNVKYSKCRE